MGFMYHISALSNTNNVIKYIGISTGPMHALKQYFTKITTDTAKNLKITALTAIKFWRTGKKLENFTIKPILT